MYVGVFYFLQLCSGFKKKSLVQALRTIIYYNKNRNSSSIHKEHFKLNMKMNGLTRKRTKKNLYISLKTYIGNKSYMETCSASYVTGKLQIKTAMA